MPVIPTLGRQSQKDRHKFKASLVYNQLVPGQFGLQSEVSKRKLRKITSCNVSLSLPPSLAHPHSLLNKSPFHYRVFSLFLFGDPQPPTRK